MVVIEIDLLWLLGILGGGALVGYAALRFRLHQLRMLFFFVAEIFREMDEAMKDDKISEDEAAAIWSDLMDVFAEFKKLLAGGKPDEPPAT